MMTAAAPAEPTAATLSSWKRVDATEFIDPEDTPKNVMLRAHRRKHFPKAEKQAKTEEYKAVYRFLYGKDASDPIVFHE